MHLTNLEKRLCDDVAGQYKEDVLRQLYEWRDEMGRELVCPRSFEHFKRNLLLRNGCAAAIRVVESVAKRLS